MVNRLKRILPLSRAIRDMTEMWLVKAGLSPASRGAMDLNVLHIKPRMSSGKSAPAIRVESSQLEVEVIHVETTAKRLVGSSAPDQAAASRPGKRVTVV
ncbi:hypothetical protein B296_00016717 [Ensete ventricosum]|uniref:Uncharacterized protein n=1 Tax=Ensete ventricosum TaxID=4639 RepID=A0A426Z6K1_ENSVE|nr:hypothetical protein B296_00016717 [Ensete ventricosum]